MMQRDPKKYLEMQRRNPQLKQDEYEFLREHASLSKDVGEVSRRTVNVHSGKEVAEGITLMGASPNIGIILDLDAVEGRFLTDVENQRRMNAAFIGNDIKTKFFPGSNPIGEMLSLEGLPFQVVGVAKAKGSVFGNSQDNFIIIPVETLSKIWGTHNGMALLRHRARSRPSGPRRRMKLACCCAPIAIWLQKDDDTFSMLTSDALLTFWKQLTGAIAATAVGVVSVFTLGRGVITRSYLCSRTISASANPWARAQPRYSQPVSGWNR